MLRGFGRILGHQQQNVAKQNTCQGSILQSQTGLPFGVLGS
jgi:hypothetical protein